MRERKFITESVKKLLVSEYIRKETESAGFGNMEMKRTPFGTNITLHVNKPGLVIGRRGSKIQEITENLEKKYGVESPQIEVKEADNPDLNPQVVSKKIALSLEKGWSYRKAGNTSLRRAVDSNVKGMMIRISGKLTGERSRTQKFFHGSVKYSGEPGRAAMLNGFSIAKMKQGVIGVTVKILDPEYRLPDVIDFIEGGTVPRVHVEENIPVEKEVPEIKQAEPEVKEESVKKPKKTEKKPETVTEKEPEQKEKPAEEKEPETKKVVQKKEKKTEASPKEPKEKKQDSGKKSKAQEKEPEAKSEPKKKRSTKQKEEPQKELKEEKAENKSEESNGANGEENKGNE